MITLHVGISEEFFRKAALDLRIQLLDDQVVRGIDGQFHELKGRGIALGVDHADETDRFPLGREDGEHIVVLDPAQVPDVDVITAVLAPRLVPQGDDVPADHRAVIEEVPFQHIPGLQGEREVVTRRRGHLIGGVTEQRSPNGNRYQEDPGR